MYPLLAIACNLQPKVIRVILAFARLYSVASGQDYSRQEGSKEGEGRKEQKETKKERKKEKEKGRKK